MSTRFNLIGLNPYMSPYKSITCTNLVGLGPGLGDCDDKKITLLWFLSLLVFAGGGLEWLMATVMVAAMSPDLLSLTRHPLLLGYLCRILHNSEKRKWKQIQKISIHCGSILPDESETNTKEAKNTRKSAAGKPTRLVLGLSKKMFYLRRWRNIVNEIWQSLVNIRQCLVGQSFGAILREAIFWGNVRLGNLLGQYHVGQSFQAISTAGLRCGNRVAHVVCPSALLPAVKERISKESWNTIAW